MHKLLHILIKTIQGILLCLLALLLVVNVYTVVRRVFYHEEMPTVFGFASAVVVSGSMEPEISVGDVVIVKSQNDYALKDVVMFYNPSSGDYTTHRIVERVDDSLFRTCGDNNDSNDPFLVAKEDVVGKVVLVVPFVGTLMSYVQNPVGFVVILVLGVAIIFLPDLILRRRDKTGEKEENSDSKEE
ncbi:MAG: signal peptidase I [Clostridia bacterium]|nr:signal peptidase I [Clostridia bacterium]